jgi:uncharacterized membrane protein
VAGIVSGDDPRRVFLIAGGAVYVLGMSGVTMAFNVPRNDVLMALVPEAAESAVAWATYVREWTNWNTARTIAGLVASLLLMLGR